MKQLRILQAFLLVLTLTGLAACDKDDDKKDDAWSADGLWISSAYGTGNEERTMFLAEINGASARLSTLKLNKGFAAVTPVKRCDATVDYKMLDHTGTITTANDPLMSFEISMAKGGRQLFVRNATARYVLTRSSSTLDEMTAEISSAYIPRVHLAQGFEGPSAYTAPGTGTPQLQGAVTAIATTDILTWVLKGIVSGASSYTGKAIISSLIQDEASKNIAAILEQVSAINARLAELINLIHNTTYEQYLNQRTNTYLNPMRNLSSEYIQRVEEAWQTDSTKVAAIVTEWANRTVGGNPAYVEVRNFIDYLTGTVVEQKNLYQVYDMYVYNTHAWEAQGYPVRDGLRAGDAAVIAQSVLLAQLYYIYGDFTDATRKSLSNELQQSLNKYMAFFKANDVEHRYDEAVCQIKGAHFVMNTGLVQRDYYKKPWFPNETPWDFENNESAWVLINGDTKYSCYQTCEFCMTAEEADAIAAYYKNSPYKTMLEVLTQEAGCTLPFTAAEMANRKVMMLLQSDGATSGQSTWNANYYITVYRVLTASAGFSHGRQVMGIAWLERHGFLWMEQWFKQWDTYYHDQLWFRTAITSRY